MQRAWERVRTNKRAAGIDKMTITAFPEFAHKHLPRILEQNSLVCAALNDAYLKEHGVPSLRNLWVVFKYRDKAVLA